MRRRVQRWGNSLAVRIPSSVAQAGALSEGTPVDVRPDGDRLVVVPERKRRCRYTLAELVAGITKGKRPRVVDTGRRVGREVW